MLKIHAATQLSFLKKKIFKVLLLFFRITNVPIKFFSEYVSQNKFTHLVSWLKLVLVQRVNFHCFSVKLVDRYNSSLYPACRELYVGKKTFIPYTEVGCTY